MTIETTDSGSRSFVLREPLENRSHKPRARKGIKAVRVIEAGTVVSVVTQDIDTGHTAFSVEQYFINGESAPIELANDLRKRDPEQCC